MIAKINTCAKVVYIVIVARSAFLRSVVIFVEYREVPTRTILPNFIGNYRDMDKREKEEAYVKEAYVRQVLSCFNLILLANQNNSPGQLSK